MDLQQIIDFFLNLNFKDHIFLGVSLFFAIIFLFIGLEKTYKIYLGAIIGLGIFSIINLTLLSLNNNDIGANFLKNFFINHKQNLGYYSIILIPLLTILIPLNSTIGFKIGKNNGLNYFLSFIFGFIFLVFFLSIFLSIINNRFLFNIDFVIIDLIKQNFLVKYIFDFFNESLIFGFLIKYDYIINLTIIVFIFYKITISGIFKFIIGKIISILKGLLKSKKE